MNQMDKKDLYQIGAITQTHGIRGEVKVFPMTDDIASLKGRKNVIIDTGKGQVLVDIVSARPQKNLAIVKFKGIDNINDVEKYKGCGLYVTADNRAPLAEDEFYLSDLIGADVVNEAGEKIGTVSDILETGANNVYEITKENGKTFLLPHIKDCVKEINIEEGFMKVFVMPGLDEE